MQNYKITIQYDGTKYKGWQRLKDSADSIQGKIENVLTEMCNHKVEIHGSGRTDAGVHAQKQIASFKIETAKSCDEIRCYMNKYLPEDIAICNVETVEERFHARLTENKKTYVYRINNSDVSNVFERKYMYTTDEKLDVDTMREAAKLLIGRHDFVGFSSLKKVKKSTERTVFDIKIEKTENDEIRIYITGDGFLYNMVRIVSGTLIEIGKGVRDKKSILEVLETKNREKAGFTAPAQGLTLYDIQYEKGERI